MSIDMLKISVRDGAIAGEAICRTLVAMLSIPVALDVDNLLKRL